MIKNPCVKCEERKMHCHAGCEKYRVYYDANRVENKARQHRRMIEEFSSDSLTRNVIIKNRRKK